MIKIRSIPHVFVIILLALLLTPGMVKRTHAESPLEKGAEPRTIRIVDFNKDMDTTVKPGDDFFQYATGGWMAAHPIPPDRSDYGAFEELEDRNNIKLRTIAQKAMNSDAPQGTALQKLGDFYQTGMDTASLEKQGLSPLKEFLTSINSIKTKDDVKNAIAMLQAMGINPFFSFHAEPDPRDSGIYMARLWQDGLSLPDRDYYIKTDTESVSIRKDFAHHMQKMFLFLGEAPQEAGKNADTVLAIETALARSSFTNVENRNPLTTNNTMTVEELQKRAPHFPWKDYCVQLGYPDIKEVNVGQTKFVTGFDHLYATTGPEMWKIFLRWKLLCAMAPYLSSPVEQESFTFFEKRLEGKKMPEPRWKRVLHAINHHIPQIMGHQYVEKYFPARSKDRMLSLTGNLKRAFGQIISGLSWMSDETKNKALEKLECMETKVGYPDKWLNCDNLEIKRDSYARNVQRASAFLFRYGTNGLNRVGQPVDRALWDMPPQIVNAMYDPFKNEIVFPAGILQPPFFDMDADDAVNYGGIGVVIGHEMTHGFDDEGRLYDRKGNLKEWWTEKDAREFKKRTDMLVREFDRFAVLPGVFINGKLTLGENIADLGGLTISMRAYRLSREEGMSNESESQETFNALQRFYLSYSRIWHTNIRKAALLKQVQTDEHSPARFRVNGEVFNVPEFYEAFPQVKKGDRLYRPLEERPVIWGLEK